MHVGLNNICMHSIRTKDSVDLIRFMHLIEQDTTIEHESMHASDANIKERNAKERTEAWLFI